MDKGIFYSTAAKGGVGVTLCTLNFAAYCAGMLPEKKTAFFDFNYYSDVHLMLGFENKKNLYNLKILLKEEGNNLQSELKSFADVCYRQNNLDIFLAPKNRTENQLALDYQKEFIEKAARIYDYIFIDAGRTGVSESRNLIKDCYILVFTTMDILSIQKTKYLLEDLKEKRLDEKARIIFNQAKDFTGKDFENIFEKPMLGAIPADRSLAWNNISLGQLIIYKKKSQFKKELGRIFQKLNIS